jgi:hypothetical protein
MLDVSERQVIWKKYGPVSVKGHWPSEYNHKIYKLYNEMELTKNTRLRGLQWVGHVMTMKEEKEPKKALKGFEEGRRPVARPRGRWLDAVGRDGTRMLKCKNCRRSAEARDGWRRRIEEDKVKARLKRHRRSRKIRRLLLLLLLSSSSSSSLSSSS